MVQSGAPLEYLTRGGVSVVRTVTEVESAAVEPLINALDSQRGVVLTSTYEYPGRYTRWDIGFIDPPLVITSRDRTVRIESLNERGELLRAALTHHLVDQKNNDSVESLTTDGGITTIQVWQWATSFTEEERSRQPSVFSVLRDIVAFFSSDDDSHLGLYGAFGYDLAFQFEPVIQHQLRTTGQRDLVLYLPDSLTIVDHMRDVSQRFDYSFGWKDQIDCTPKRRR